MNPAFDRITIDPAVMNGQPCIRGMRLTVKRVVRAMAAYPDRAELKQEYPGRTRTCAKPLNLQPAISTTKKSFWVSPNAVAARSRTAA
jgi:hypothetical protein